MTIPMLKLYSNRVRGLSSNVGDDRNRPEMVALIAEAGEEGCQHIRAGWLFALPRVASDHRLVAVVVDRSAVWNELTALVEHLLGERQRRVKQPVEIILRLLRGGIAPRTHCNILSGPATG